MTVFVKTKAVGRPSTQRLCPKKVVLVTGSSGFLGQHIIKHLQEQDDDCEEIRLFDVERYVNRLDHSTAKPMVEFRGDIRNKEDLLKAFAGVGCVIHCAACIDVSLHAKKARLESVNVLGTKNVVEACVQSNVQALIFTSTTDTILSTNHVFFAREYTTRQPSSSKLLFEAFAKSKLDAERVVLGSNNRLTENRRNRLKTCVLRPTILYGEEDQHFIKVLMKMAKYYGFDILPRVQSIDERLQMTYVGNAALAHLNAKQSLLNVSEQPTDPIYYITDDTPLEQFFDAVKPFVEAQDVRVSSVTIPWIVAIIIMSIICRILLLSEVIFPVEKYFPTPAMINYTCSKIFVDRKKASMYLKYYPTYSYAESKKRSLEYYKSVRIKV